MATRLAPLSTYPTRAARLAVVVIATSCLLACRATPDPLPEKFIANAAEFERQTLEDVTEAFPHAADELERSVGYAIFTSKAAKVPVLGRGEGTGVTVDRRDDARHYLSVTHFDVGGGVGAVAYRFVIVFFDEKDFERLRSGTLHVDLSIDTVTAGNAEESGTAGRGTSKQRKRVVYVLSDSGAAATWVVRMFRFRPLSEG